MNLIKTKRPLSIQSYIASVVMRWSAWTTLASLLLALPFLIHVVISSAEHQIATVAETSVQALRPLILSGNIKQAEAEMRSLFHLDPLESMTVLDTKLRPVYIRDKKEGAESLPTCGGKAGICWNRAHTFVSALIPIYFDQEQKILFGYLGIHLRAPIDVILILGLVVMVLSLQLFSAVGIVLRLSSLAQEIGRNLEGWAAKLRSNPKSPCASDAAPYSELVQMNDALSGLHREILRLEKVASEQAQLDLMRGLAHDIVAPALRLSKMADLLRKLETLNSDPSARLEIIRSIQQETKRLSYLANEVKLMREVSDRHPGRANMAQCNLGLELENLIGDLSKDDEVIKSQVKIELIKPDTPSLAKLSPSDCFRIFSNLIRNAVQASPINKTVVVTISANEGAPMVEVRDEGHGMTPEIMDRIFELNFTTKENVGTGLGLPIVKSICDFNRATIEVSSTPKRGSIFTLRFLSASMYASSPEQSNVQRSAGGLA